MAKKRFRDVKQTTFTSDKEKTPLPTFYYASSGFKIKAFITDVFFLLLPILYFVFYFIFDGRDDFANNKLFGWVVILLPFIVIQTLFFYFGNGQTPGYRNYTMKLIDAKTKQTPSLFVIIFRNVVAVISFFSIVGWILMFFRKDSKTLHDLLSATEIIFTNDNND